MKKKKLPGLNFTKEGDDQYSENYKILIKGIQMTKTNRKIFHAPGLEELILLKQPYYQIMLQIQCNPYLNTNKSFPITKTNNCKICMEPQKTLNIQSNVQKEEQSWIYQIPDYIIYHNGIIIKAVCYWHKNRHQLNGTKQRAQK